MNTAIIWVIVGIALILSELMATSIVAVFLGIGALVTGLLVWLGWVDSLGMQFTLFGMISLLSLVVARKHFQRLFGGFTADAGEQGSQFQRDIGERVTVAQDFSQGSGRVTLNGVAWDAESADDLKAGEVAWVIANEGIHLTVTRQKPGN